MNAVAVPAYFPHPIPAAAGIGSFHPSATAGRGAPGFRGQTVRMPPVITASGSGAVRDGLPAERRARPRPVDEPDERCGWTSYWARGYARATVCLNVDAAGGPRRAFGCGGPPFAATTLLRDQPFSPGQVSFAWSPAVGGAVAVARLRESAS